MQKAIIFIRTTVETNVIDKRIDKLINYCSDNNLSVIKQYVFCAKRNNTKFLKNLYEDIKAISGEHINIAIVVNYVDRLQRSSDDSYLINKLRKEGKIEVHFLKEGLIIHKDSKSADLTFWNMHVLFANAQINNMVDKVKDSQAKNWSEGKWQGTAPLGYLNRRDDDNKAIIIVDPVRAPIIQRIYQEYATGLHTVKSVWCLAKDLGLYTRMKKKKGCLVTRNTIYEVLTNPFYYGEMCIKGKIMPHIYSRQTKSVVAVTYYGLQT